MDSFIKIMAIAKSLAFRIKFVFKVVTTHLFLSTLDSVEAPTVALEVEPFLILKLKLSYNIPAIFFLVQSILFWELKS